MAWTALGLVCLVVGGFLKWPEAVESPASDSGMFATYGAMLLHGARPYIDFWDVHPPLVFADWALVEAIAGPDWLRTCLPGDTLLPHSCIALVAHSLDLLLSVAASIVSAMIVRGAGGSRAAAAFAALLVVGFSDQAMLSQEGSNPSKLTLLPSTLAVWAYLRSLNDCHCGRNAFLAGVAAGIASLAKQPALLTLVALGLHAAVWERNSRRVVLLMLGASATAIVACVALAALGSLGGFVAEAWLYNIERVVVGYFVHPIKPPTLGLARVVIESAGVIAAAGVVGAALIGRAPANRTQIVLVWWAAVNVVAVTAFREFVYVVPSLAVVGALGLERIWRWRSIEARMPMRVLMVATMATALVLTTSFQRAELARARFERGDGSALRLTEQLGRVLRRDLPPGPLFIYGNGAEMYLLANRAPATRYLNAEALRATAPGVANTRADLVSSLRRHPPPVVALAPHSDEAELNLADYPSMRLFLAECYVAQPIRPDIDVSWIILVQTGACGPI